jgi:hypothetical protein
MEMLVVMLIATVIMLASFDLLDDTNRITQLIETRNDLPVIAQGAVNEIQNALTQSRQVFDNSGVGPDYFDALVIPSSSPLLDDSRLPTAKTTLNEFVPDADGETFTGNCLLVARQLGALTVNYAADGGGSLAVDRYRFEFYYLTPRTNWNFAGSSVGHLDIVRGRSATYADYFQLNNTTLTDDQRDEVNSALIDAGVEVAWNPGAAIDAGFFDIETDGGYTLDASPSINVSDVKSLTPQIDGAHIFGKMSYTVGFRGHWTDTLTINWRTSTPGSTPRRRSS